MVATNNGLTAVTTTPAVNAPASEALSEAKKKAELRPEQQKAALNGQILQASLQVSIQSGNDGLALLYRSAIEQLNTALAPELGPNAIQNAMGQDNSAEATASRILSLSTGFFDAYAARYPDKDPEAVAKEFVALIRGGFEKGYGEAKDILTGLNVLGENSTIASGIAKTYDLVQKGYDDFLAGKLSALRGEVDTNSAA
ncbi:DUF5610 domain-containing protein [Methylobacillus gramineus]|uniref:DUF5610 domain-containing protein n=1 Tax=Methylobacillus gramineus TaxID=755169 RepID=UPI001D000334|nr:DUF5610 domain-containing protein [Methylobacillus gramineus]MCB5184047.1 DUF5610 domain-containing protein [Methylobacillus gramineus]